MPEAIQISKVPSGLAQFLIKAYKMPQENVADVVLLADDLDVRNAIYFKTCLAHYLTKFEGYTPDEAVEYLSTPKTIDTAEWRPMQDRFLATAVFLTFPSEGS